VVIAPGIIMGALLIVGHHVLSEYLDGRSATHYSQFWIKTGGNAIANAVTICLGIAASGALAQIVSITNLLLNDPNNSISA
jgi:hypothetical protein